MLTQVRNEAYDKCISTRTEGKKHTLAALMRWEEPVCMYEIGQTDEQDHCFMLTVALLTWPAQQVSVIAMFVYLFVCLSVIITSCTPGAKSVIYDCPVCGLC